MAPQVTGLPRQSSHADDVSDDEWLEPELKGVAFEYIKHQINQVGPDLLQSVIDTRPCFELPTDRSAEWWTPQRSQRKRTPPLSASLARPSHLLDIAFDDQPSSSQLVPAHGLAWALRCKSLTALAKASSSSVQVLAAFADDDESPFALTVAQLRLPSARAFEFVHSWMYISQPHKLRQQLLQLPQAVEPLSPASSPRPFEGESDDDESASLAGECGSKQPRAAILDRLELVQEIGNTVTVLEIEDEQLVDCLRQAWDELLAQLGP